MELDYRIAEVLRVMEKLDSLKRKTALPRPSEQVVKRGIELSGTVCAQEKYVFATPLMKNLLVVMGDVQQTQGADGEWHTSKLEAGVEAKAVKFMNEVVDRCLIKFNGPKKEGYDHSVPVDSVELYNTDCWLGWKPTIWDIVPGQEEALKKDFPTYSNPKTNFSYEDMVSLIRKDTSLQKAILLMLEKLPEVKASGKVLDVSDPFMSKKTGVSYPFYYNDSTFVKKGSTLTYGQLCINLVEKAFSSKGIEGLKQIAYDNNVYTGYTRRQRGKPRPLRAESRLTNLVVNMINSPEMENWKTLPIGLGFMPYDQFKERLIEMARFVIANPGYIAINKDFTSYDSTVGYGWQCLQNALRHMRANGSLSKALVEIRHVCGTKALFIDGVNKRVYPIYGRQMSGYDDTTLGNTTISNLLSSAANNHVDPNYTKNVVYPMKNKNLATLGDDVIDIILKGSEKEWVKYVNSLGFVAHEDNKDAFGVMFLQYRLFRDGEDWIMAYNWPRVLRSMLSKENSKGLGKAGWTLSFYQQLEKLVEYKPALSIVLNICAALDKEHLMLNVPIDKVKEMVQNEDRERMEREKNKNKFVTTAERLATNPQFSRGFKNYDFDHSNHNIEIDFDHFGQLQQKFREVYNPNFLPSLGFENPDLSKVH